jgi:hypothetical protein
MIFRRHRLPLQRVYTREETRQNVSVWNILTREAEFDRATGKADRAATEGGRDSTEKLAASLDILFLQDWKTVKEFTLDDMGP